MRLSSRLILLAIGASAQFPSFPPPEDGDFGLPSTPEDITTDGGGYALPPPPGDTTTDGRDSFSLTGLFPPPGDTTTDGGGSFSSFSLTGLPPPPEGTTDDRADSFSPVSLRGLPPPPYGTTTDGGDSFSSFSLTGLPPPSGGTTTDGGDSFSSFSIAGLPPPPVDNTSDGGDTFSSFSLTGTPPPGSYDSTSSYPLTGPPPSSTGGDGSFSFTSPPPLGSTISGTTLTGTVSGTTSSEGPLSSYYFPNKHSNPFYYQYHGEEKCAIINVAMDESGSMVTEQQFMRDRAINRMVQYLNGNKHQFDKVFVCSNGFGNNPGGNPNADAEDGYRHLGCSLGYDRSILQWSYWNEGRNEDGYSATIKSINNVPEVIGGVNLTATCKTAALNMILVSDEDRDPVTEVTKADVRKRLAETGYVYNIVVNVFIKNAAANIIGMRYNYNPNDYPRLMFPSINPETGIFRFYGGGDIPNEIFSAKTENGVIQGEYLEEMDPTFLYKELMTNGHGYTIEDYGEIIEGTKGTIFSIQTMRKGTKGNQPRLADAFANALVDIKICEMTQCREPEVGGDPHITTWKNEHYEFHGQCDLVLAKDPSWGGLGLDVHIRTKIVRYWSYIKAAAIRIGDDILEVEGGTEMNTEPKFWFNYEYLGDLTTFAGFPVTQESNKIHRRSYTIDLNIKFKGRKIVIDLYREFVRVKFDGGLDTFGNTVGLLGDPRSGALLARDGHTEFNDYVEFGNEWQVLPSDGNLFHESSHPHFPERCLQPEDPQGERRRRLDESSITIEQAEAACGPLKDPLSIMDCVYDVLATQDLDMIGAF